MPGGRDPAPLCRAQHGARDGRLRARLLQRHVGAHVHGCVRARARSVLCVAVAGAVGCAVRAALCCAVLCLRLQSPLVCDAFWFWLSVSCCRVSHTGAGAGRPRAAAGCRRQSARQSANALLSRCASNVAPAANWRSQPGAACCTARAGQGARMLRSTPRTAQVGIRVHSHHCTHPCSLATVQAVLRSSAANAWVFFCLLPRAGGLGVLAAAVRGAVS